MLSAANNKPKTKKRPLQDAAAASPSLWSLDQDSPGSQEINQSHEAFLMMISSSSKLLALATGFTSGIKIASKM